MEVFLDFGLFEVVAAIGLAALSRVIYSRRATGLVFLAASVAAPAALLLRPAAAQARWRAAAALATALVNGVVILAALQQGDVPRLKLPRRSPPNPPIVVERADGLGQGSK